MLVSLNIYLFCPVFIQAKKTTVSTVPIIRRVHLVVHSFLSQVVPYSLLLSVFIYYIIFNINFFNLILINNNNIIYII